MAKFKFILWLAYWYDHTRTFSFQWDKGNSTKSRDKHNISQEEFEEVFILKFGIPIGTQVSPAIEKEDRYCIIGPTQNGKMLSVVFTFRNSQIRPISGRLASRKEKKLYEEIRKALEGI